MEGMVPRARLEAVQERLEAALAFHRAEADGMRRLVVAAAAAADGGGAGSPAPQDSVGGGGGSPEGNAERLAVAIGRAEGPRAV
jgi:hypothetical protein